MNTNDPPGGGTTPLSELAEFNPELVSFLVGPQPGTPVPGPEPAAPEAAGPERRLSDETAVRLLATAAVLLVAAIAAVVSFVHIQHLAATHGQDWLASRLLPFSVDGTVAAAGLSMLWAARKRLATPWLARIMLFLGVLATLAANVAYGFPFGITGALISGWPAVAFVGSVEMLLAMVRRANSEAEAPVPAAEPAVPAPPAGLNGHAAAAVRMFGPDVREGRIPGVRRIRRAMSVGQPKAQQIREYLRQLTPGQLAAAEDGDSHS